MAVSYTHLDVYKRQGHDRCEEGDDPDESRHYGMLAFTPLDYHRKGDQQEEGPVEAKGDPSNPTDGEAMPVAGDWGARTLPPRPNFHSQATL